MRLLLTLAALLLASFAPAQKTQDDFFKALGHVESGNNDAAVGDNGASIGRYQIQEAYWKDALAHDPSIGGSYKDVTNEAYARKVILAYMARYAKEALESNDWETLARIHNGGPKIMSRKGTRAWKATTKYWAKVKAAMG